MTKRGNGDDVVSVDEEENGGSEKEATTTQAVQVAVNIRPLIAMERVQGCSDCIAIVPGEPQGVHKLLALQLAWVKILMQASSIS
jgi:hypothetical protein